MHGAASVSATGFVAILNGTALASSVGGAKASASVVALAAVHATSSRAAVERAVSAPLRALVTPSHVTSPAATMGATQTVSLRRQSATGEIASSAASVQLTSVVGLSRLVTPAHVTSPAATMADAMAARALCAFLTRLYRAALASAVADAQSQRSGSFGAIGKVTQSFTFRKFLFAKHRIARNKTRIRKQGDWIQ